MDTTSPTTTSTRTIPGVPIFGAPSDETLDRIEALIAAFLLDDFIVDGIAISSETSIGLSARHATATIGSTGQYKRAYYVEGSPYDLGYLTGRLAEPSVSRMTTTFLDNVVLSFLGVHLDPVLQKIIGSLLADVAFLGAKRSIPDVPQAYQDELNGILAGCRAANPMTKVTTDRLWTLNVGIDAALAFIYTLKLPTLLPMHAPLRPEHFRIPFMCTGFTLSGTDNEQKPFHYFGRDFMFTTANVFQDTACPIIYRPTGGQTMVSMAAPGWMGSITAMNAGGVGGSVNMAPSALCNPERPGLNSLLLNRDAIQNGATANDALQVMVQAQRGCSWIHILADGSTDDAYVVEAGMSQSSIDFMSYPPSQLGTALQQVPQLLQEYPATVQNGLVARAADSPFPSEYISGVNPGLFAAFKANPGAFHYDVQPTYTYTYAPTAFGPGGFVNATCNTHNCPMGLYFAPPRQGLPNLLVATNRFITPAMQLTTMAEPADHMAQHDWDDVQWRYDELAYTVERFAAQNQAATGHSYITYEQAKEAANYLTIDGQFPGYNNPTNLPADQVQIGGAVSIMDLKAKTMESYYGYYSDQWVRTTLPNYVV